jgi:thiamine kinase-like enzyme
MKHEQVHLDRIHALGLWRGPIAAEPLPGGITNFNYLVRDAVRSYVVRLCEERPLLGIDRRNEVLCQRAAHALGLAPEVVHHEPGILVSLHVAGRTLAPADVRDPAFIPRLAALLHRLHDGWDRLTGEILYFSPFQAARTYAATARRLGASLPADLDDLLDDARRLARQVGPFVPTLCHNDLLAGNILDDGGRIRLVDWEYAGIGHPLFDLAGVAANCVFPESAEVALLEAYRGSIDEPELCELRILRTMSSIREALWAAIQSVASDIDFDYPRYADDNFAAYRQARHLLDLSPIRHRP